MRDAQSNAQIDFARLRLSNDTDTHFFKLPIFAPVKEPQMSLKSRVRIRGGLLPTHGKAFAQRGFGSSTEEFSNK